MNNEQDNNLKEKLPNISESGKQSVDLSSPGVAALISKRLKNDIDKYCEITYDDGHRTHLGASLIGKNCKRYLWYIFRHCKKEKFDGRKQRLFNRGHREEARFIEWLEGIGAQLWANDYQSDPLFYCSEDDTYYLKSELTTEILQSLAYKVEEKLHIDRAKAQGIKFKQYRISGVDGHFGGSLDGIIILPPEYGINEPLLAEFKTNGTGAGFKNLTENGMALSKQEHFAQTSTYGYKYKFRYVAYFNINKNDDDLHVEIVKLNWELGEQMELKAEQVIKSQIAPPRLSDNPTYKDCSYCDMKGICHSNHLPEKNCRSCINARPVENAQWHCSIHNGIIPKEFIKIGCESYKAITLNT